MKVVECYWYRFKFELVDMETFEGSDQVPDAMGAFQSFKEVSHVIDV